MRWPASFICFALMQQFCFSQQYKHFYGNIHSHTGFSDGNKDSAVSGVAKPDGSFSYAKLSEDFDFLGISEHNHYSSKGNPGFRRHLYQQGIAMADAANLDGDFVALYGIEYGVSSQYNGHVIIYGMDKLPGWEESVPGMTGANYDVFNAKTDYAGLFQKVLKTPGAFCYLAHPSFSDFSTDGTWNTALANATYNASFDSVIVGMPLRSGLATNSGATYSDYPQSDYFNYYKKMLYNGYHLGIGYDHDNHYTNFGRGNGGRLVILADSLSRKSFYDAMHNRRFYGSDDRNARIYFSCNGAVMGSITKGSQFPILEVKHEDPDGELADSIKIWKGYKNSGALWAEVVHLSVGSNVTVFTDEKVVNNKEYFYFAEIRQKDQQWIVTSPVWYTAEDVVSAASHILPEVVVSYEPTGRMLHVAVNTGAGNVLQIVSIQGKIIEETHFTGNTTRRDISDLPAGLYLLRVSDGNYTLNRKLVVP